MASSAIEFALRLPIDYFTIDSVHTERDINTDRIIKQFYNSTAFPGESLKEDTPDDNTDIYYLTDLTGRIGSSSLASDRPNRSPATA